MEIIIRTSSSIIMFQNTLWNKYWKTLHIEFNEFLFARADPGSNFGEDEQTGFIYQIQVEEKQDRYRPVSRLL